MCSRDQRRDPISPTTLYTREGAVGRSADGIPFGSQMIRFGRNFGWLSLIEDRNLGQIERLCVFLTICIATSSEDNFDHPTLQLLE